MIPQLEVHNFGNTDIFVSREIIAADIGLGILNSQENLDSVAERTLRSIYDRNPSYRELVELNSKERGLNGTAILMAHRTFGRPDRWYYRDGSNPFEVQDWIDQMDGRYAVQILICCNPKGHRVSSKKSAVVASTQSYNLYDLFHGNIPMELYVPAITQVSP